MGRGETGEGEWSVAVRELRRRLAQTQQMLAFELGVARETVSRWESGKDEPSTTWKRRIRRLLSELEQQDSLTSLIDMVETSDGLATLLDHDFNIVRLSPRYREMSLHDTSELYGRPSQQYWSEPMGAVIGRIGGLKAYKERGIRRLDLKLEVIRQPGEPGYLVNTRLFTVGSTITFGPANAPIAYLTQMRLETSSQPSPPMIKVAGSDTLVPLD